MAIAAVFDLELPRRADDVFAALADLESYPGWLVSSGVVSAATVDPPIGAGTKIRIQQQVAGRTATLDGRVTAFESPRHFAIQARDADGITVAIDALISPDGATCGLRWSLRIALPMRFRFFESMVAPQVREAAAADLERLRRRLSAVAD
jgi:uncharacterized protein YndB with AHSA1/START domain